MSHTIATLLLTIVIWLQLYFVTITPNTGDGEMYDQGDLEV